MRGLAKRSFQCGITRRARCIKQLSTTRSKIVTARQLALRPTKLNRKLDREQTAKKALAKYEIDRLAILAKTKRLRAERLARIDAEPKKPTKV